MARTFVTRTCLIAVSLVALALQPAIARSPPIKTNAAQSITPQSADRKGVTLDGMNEPLIILRDALKRKPHAVRFRVKWFDMVLSQDYNSIALYDRTRHTLIFDCHGHWDGGRLHERILYTGVTDTVISRAAKASEGQMQVDFLADGFRGFFETLPLFGATRQKNLHTGNG